MRFLIRKDRLYWSGARWVMNPRKALRLAQIPARKIAREVQGELEAVK